MYQLSDLGQVTLRPHCSGARLSYVSDQGTGFGGEDGELPSLREHLLNSFQPQHSSPAKWEKHHLPRWTVKVMEGEHLARRV